MIKADERAAMNHEGTRRDTEMANAVAAERKNAGQRIPLSIRTRKGHHETHETHESRRSRECWTCWNDQQCSCSDKPRFLRWYVFSFRVFRAFRGLLRGVHPSRCSSRAGRGSGTNANRIPDACPGFCEILLGAVSSVQLSSVRVKRSWISAATARIRPRIQPIALAYPRSPVRKPVW